MTEHCTCKVGRVADRYDLDELDEQLRHNHEEGVSLRKLTRRLNKRILGAAIEDAGDISTLLASDRGIDTLYDALREKGETQSTEAIRVRTRLEQSGLDVDSVTADWVSHATIKTHLNECLDIDTSRDPSITTEDAINTIEWSRSRSESVVSETIERLRNADQLDVEDPTTTVTIRISCDSCGRSYTVRSLLEDGGCACKPDGD